MQSSKLKEEEDVEGKQTAHAAVTSLELRYLSCLDLFPSWFCMSNAIEFLRLYLPVTFFFYVFLIMCHFIFLSHFFHIMFYTIYIKLMTSLWHISYIKMFSLKLSEAKSLTINNIGCIKGNLLWRCWVASGVYSCIYIYLFSHNTVL